MAFAERRGERPDVVADSGGILGEGPRVEGDAKRPAP